MNLINNFLFIALPYVAIVVFLVGAVYRYRATGFKYSSLSSPFLEGRGIYIFAVLFHWGILVGLLLVRVGHVAVSVVDREAQSADRRHQRHARGDQDPYRGGLRHPGTD